MKDQTIELPPLPSSYNESGSYVGYGKSDLANYARAAIESDRQRRSVPVAWRIRHRSEPGMIGHYPWSYTDRIRGGRDDIHYEYEPLFAAPQPAEPVKKKDWNVELSSWSDEDFVQVFHECPDLADQLRRVLAEPVKKKPYAQGSALGEFGVIPMCDQVNDEPVKVPSDAELWLEEAIEEVVIAALEEGMCGKAMGNTPFTDSAKAGAMQRIRALLARYTNQENSNG